MIYEFDIVNLFAFMMFCLLFHLLLGVVVFSGLNFAKFFAPIAFALVYLMRKLVDLCCCCKEWKIAIHKILDGMVEAESGDQVVGGEVEDGQTLDLQNQSFDSREEITEQRKSQILDSSDQSQEQLDLVLDTPVQSQGDSGYLDQNQEHQDIVLDASVKSHKDFGGQNQSKAHQDVVLDTPVEGPEDSEYQDENQEQQTHVFDTTRQSPDDLEPTGQNWVHVDHF